MKINHSVDKQTFNPVTITFKFETPEELATLWHLLNNPVNTEGMREMVEASSLSFIPPSKSVGWELWTAVDRASRDSGLRESLSQ